MSIPDADMFYSNNREVKQNRVTTVCQCLGHDDI